MAASPIESELASQQKRAVAWDRFRVTDVLDALVQSHVEKSTKESPSADCVSSGFAFGFNSVVSDSSPEHRKETSDRDALH